MAPTRRQVAVSLGVALAWPELTARAQEARLAFRAVQVDVAPLVARGGGGPARVISQVLPREMATSFADHIVLTKAAPVLVARIDTLYLSDFSEAPGAFEAGLHNDSMSGAGLVMAGTEVVSTTPLTVHLPASYSGAYYLPDINLRRITSLCQSFASWLRREMNL